MRNRPDIIGPIWRCRHVQQARLLLHCRHHRDSSLGHYLGPGRAGGEDRGESRGCVTESGFRDEVRGSPWIERRRRPYLTVCGVVVVANRVRWYRAGPALAVIQRSLRGSWRTRVGALLDLLHSHEAAAGPRCSVHPDEFLRRAHRTSAWVKPHCGRRTAVGTARARSLSTRHRRAESSPGHRQ